MNTELQLESLPEDSHPLNPEEVKLQFIGLLTVLRVCAFMHDPQTMINEALLPMVDCELTSEENPKASEVLEPSGLARLVLAQQALTDSANHQLYLERDAQDHDRLTGLYNLRPWFEEVVKSEKQGWVGFLDLDGFKALNDGLGHEEVDKILWRLGRDIQDKIEIPCLVTNSGGEVLVCRRSGDEFMIMIPEGVNTEYVIERIVEIFNDINESDPLQRSKAKLGATIGFARYEHNGSEKERADRLREAMELADNIVSNEKEAILRKRLRITVRFIMKILKLSPRGMPSDGNVNFVYSPDNLKPLVV